MGNVQPPVTQYGQPAGFYPVARAVPTLVPSLAGASSSLASSPAQMPFMSPGNAPPRLINTFQSPAGHPVQVYLLKNGHRVVIEQTRDDIVSLRTFINAGSVNENPVYKSALYSRTGVPSGLAHLDEHCHFLKTQHYPQKNTWVQATENLGARLNASTGHELIQHELTFNKEVLMPMIRQHGESVLHSFYDPNAIRQEITNVLNEAQESIHDPDQQVNSKIWELLFERSGFQSLGTRKDVLNSTAQDLTRFFQTFYRPTQMMTVISGNIDPAATLSAINREFSANPARSAPPNNAALQVALGPTEIRHATIYNPKLSAHSIVSLGFPGPDLENYRDRAAVEVLLNLLGSGPLSTLQQLKDTLVDPKTGQKAIHAVDISLEPMKKAGAAGVYLQAQPGSEQLVSQAVLNLLQGLQQNPVAIRELEQTKNQIIYGFEKGLNDVDVRTMLMGMEMYTGKADKMLPQYYLNYQQLIKNVTPADVMRVAQRYLNPARYALVYGLPGRAQADSGNRSNYYAGWVPGGTL
ncbi:MAG: insulinase family protein [Vampirovibrio sp.]|nr:insulinase family protein [Vampirovibrio sp.]